MISGGELLRGGKGVYRVGEIVGEGGFAVVYRAHTEGADVAVKFLRAENVTPASRARFRQEAAALSRLDHPSIAPLLDSGEWEGRAFLVMPWLGGVELGAMIKRQGPLSAELVIDMARAVGGALACAHAAGIVHRDITPSNILRSGEKWWLVDFGLALDAEADQDQRVTSTGTVVGTSAYMSPEQVAGSRALDASSDQYSFACVLYEALAGVPPFVAASAQATRAMRLYSDPQDLALHRPGLPAGTRGAIHRAMSREPADRFGGMNDFLGAFDRVAASAPAPARLARSWQWLGVLGIVGAASMAMFAWTRPSRSVELTVPALDPRHVAVRFFEDLTPDRSMTWLARGISRDLIHELSNLDTLSVVSAGLMERYRDPLLSVDSVARAVSAGTLIEGTVQVKRPGQVQVIVQLTDASAGYRVKSWSFDQPLDEVPSMLDELQYSISSHLREQLGLATARLEQRSRAQSADAWRHFHEGMEQYEAGAAVGRFGESRRAWEILDRADALFAIAANQEPQWADPWIMRAKVARWRFLSLTLTEPVAGQGRGSAGMLDVGLRSVAAGQRHAEQALLLDARSADAAVMKAYFHFIRWQVTGAAVPSVDMETSEALIRQALGRTRKQALAWVLLGRIYRFRGMLDSADVAAEQAFTADPFLVEGRRALADRIGRHLEAQEWNDAARLCRSTRERYADDRELPECRLQIMGWTAAAPESVAAAWHELATIEANAVPAQSTSWTLRRAYVALIAARAGLSDSAYAIIRRAYRERGANRADSTQVAIAEARIHVLTGDTLSATAKLDSLERAEPSRRARLRTHPWFDGLLGTRSSRPD